VQRTVPHPLPAAADDRRAPHAPDLTLEAITAEDAFLALREQWNALVSACPVPNVFLRHEWFDAAWQWRRLDATLRTLVARRDGALVGALPSSRRRASASKSPRA
jgi:hypothetical protein